MVPVVGTDETDEPGSERHQVLMEMDGWKHITDSTRAGY